MKLNGFYVKKKDDKTEWTTTVYFESKDEYFSVCKDFKSRTDADKYAIDKIKSEEVDNLAVTGK